MYLAFKRFMDITLSLLGLILFSPFLLIISIAIKLDSKGPVLFKQKRVGLHKKTFNMCKFRTMNVDVPGNVPTHLLENPEKCITRIGEFLRKTSLDETIQLIHVIKGEMSIIGPRPALWNQFDLIELRDKYGANDVRPGITGLAQISGRDELPIEEKARLDGEYVKNISLSMDFKCFFGTVIAVLIRKGIIEGATDTAQTVNATEQVHQETIPL